MGVAATGAALALMGTLLMAAPALAAENDPALGYVAVTLDFTDPASLGVVVTTQNLSERPAYGSGVVRIPSGRSISFGPRLYAPGETLTHSEAAAGHPCEDLHAMSISVYGVHDLSDEHPAWSSGVIEFPDPRITVIGCGPCAVPDDDHHADTYGHPDPDDHADGHADTHGDAHRYPDADDDRDDHTRTRGGAARRRQRRLAGADRNGHRRDADHRRDGNDGGRRRDVRAGSCPSNRLARFTRSTARAVAPWPRRIAASYVSSGYG